MPELFDHPVRLGVALIVGMLTIATLIVAILKRARSTKDQTELADRIKSWWVMIAVFSAALLSPPIVSVWFFGLVSYLAFKEFVSIVPLRRADRRSLFYAYLAIPIQYALVAHAYYGLFIVFIPVWVFFLLPFRFILAKQTAGFLQSISMVSWGLMITVFAVSHAAMLIQFPADQANPAGGAGLILFLAVLNQGNDVAQFVWGKLLGRRKILPDVSPNKTWEGFLGGAATTTLLAALLHGWLTPFSLPFSLFIGAALAGAGFIGDVTLSAIKRDLKIKDAGALIPGHGGILDRIDSLSLSAPLFFHTVRFFYY